MHFEAKNTFGENVEIDNIIGKINKYNKTS